MGDNKEKATKAFENLAPLFGLGAKIGAAIPGLKKPKKSNDSAVAARQTSMRAAGAAVGASQQGFGASRGLALRSGLRAASKIAREGAYGAAVAADADQKRYEKRVDERNTRLSKFGSDLAETGAQVGQGIVESRQARAAADAEAEKKARELQIQQMQESLPSMEDVLGIDPITGIQRGAEPANPQQLNPLEEIPVGAQGPTLDELDAYGEPTTGGQQIGEVPSIGDLAMDPAIAQLGVADKETLYSIAPELELQHRLENFAIDEAYRTGTNMNRIYARLRRLQQLPAINATIDMNRQMQLQMPQLGGQ